LKPVKYLKHENFKKVERRSTASKASKNLKTINLHNTCMIPQPVHID